MMRVILAVVVAAASGQVLAQETYRYENSARASDYAREIFGKPGAYENPPQIDLGHYDIGVASTLDCGKLDIRANLVAEYEELQRQLKSLIPADAQEAVDLASKGAFMAVCYAYPTVCAQLRHDYLSMQGSFNLRAQACSAIDKFIDSQAEKGAKQLRAEAQANCVSEKLASMSMMAATRACQDETGLPLRDFQYALGKRFTKEKQKVLAAMMAFAREKDTTTHALLASLLGEIEVQQDGYWQPLFENGLTRPGDLADRFIAESEGKACSNRLDAIISRRSPSAPSPVDKSIDETIARRLTADDVQNLGDLSAQDRQLACAALGRAIGKLAAQVASSKAEAALASGLLNTAIPTGLRDEYRARGQGAFEALRASLESDQIPPLDEVRATISRLAHATREKNRMIAAGISKGRIENYRQEVEKHSDCTDTLSCGE